MMMSNFIVTVVKEGQYAISTLPVQMLGSSM
jgi:hypothetical protein